MNKDITQDDMEEIQNSEDTYIIDFWADWCQPCHKLAPEFEQVAEERDDLNFGKVDMEENQEIGVEYGVRSLPTILIIQNGEEVARKSGSVKADELSEWIDEELS